MTSEDAELEPTDETVLDDREEELATKLEELDLEMEALEKLELDRELFDELTELDIELARDELGDATETLELELPIITLDTLDITEEVTEAVDDDELLTWLLDEIRL